MNDTTHAMIAADQAENLGLLRDLPPTFRWVLDKARAEIMSSPEAEAHRAQARTIELVIEQYHTIPVYGWERVQTDFARLVKKAQNRGLPAPRLIEVGQSETHVHALLVGAAPVFRGWRLLGSLESLIGEDGEPRQLVRTAPGVEMPEQYRTAPEKCDHCRTARRRTLTFVLQHEDGRTAQVGSTCINEFLGTDALRSWVIFGDLHRESEAILDGWTGTFSLADYDAYRRRHGYATAIATAVFLTYVLQRVEERGFVSGSWAYTSGSTSTGRGVWHDLAWREWPPTELPTNAHRDAADAILDWASKAADDSDYWHNVQAILATGEVRMSDANLIASLVPGWHRSQLPQPLSEHVPHCEVGDRVVLDLTLVTHHRYENAYGTIRMFVFHDSEGRTVKWSCTSGTPWIDDKPLFEHRGKRFRVVGTVRRLGEYKGVLETSLQRCSIHKIDEDGNKLVAAMRKWAKTRRFELPEWAQEKKKP